ncbi:MAG: DUF5131 family protein [Bradyrhizobium sp.]
MADKSGIEWTDATVNFWWGCTKVGPGCDHCYAEAIDRRYGGTHWGLGAPRRKIKGAVALIHRLDNDYSWWSADHFGGFLPATCGPRRRVFVQSMSDLLDTEVPLEWFAEAWEHIEACSRLAIQVVTKRVSVIEKRLAAIGRTSWPRHAGLIVTVVNQVEAGRDVPRLISLKKALSIPWIGLSIEPMLGPIDLTPWLADLDWIISGGESGPHARPMHPDWVRSIRDQCAAAGVPFHHKQNGEFASEGLCAERWLFSPTGEAHPDPLPNGIGRHTKEGWTVVYRVGKRFAGRLLDGVVHNAFPEALQ